MNDAPLDRYLFDDAGDWRDTDCAAGKWQAGRSRGGAHAGAGEAWSLAHDEVPEPEMACLLANLLRHMNLSEASPLTVQMLACGPASTIGSAAYGLARASATGLGRTLLAGGAPARAPQAGRARIGRLIPDATLARLFHFDSDGNGAALLGLARGCEPSLLTTEPFRMVIFQSKPSDGGAALTAAPFCSGTILVVQAGVTTQAAVRQAARAVARAGGRVVGTILAGLA